MSLIFDHDTHSYTLNGQKLPSVTQILRPLGMYNGIPEHILRSAAERGTNVHMACEYDDDGDLDYNALIDEYRPYVDAWRAFKADHAPRFIGCEQRVYNRALMYAGTYDRLADIDGKRVLIDIKTTRSNMPSLAAQLAAYAHCLDALPDYCMGVQLMPDGSYVTHKHLPTDGWPLFLSLLTVRQFSVQHGLKNSFTV